MEVTMSSVGWTGAGVKTYTYVFGAAHPTLPMRLDLNLLITAWRCSLPDVGALMRTSILQLQ
jgi:hypothetical protein